MNFIYAFWIPVEMEGPPSRGGPLFPVEQRERERENKESIV